jgi:aspartokinase
MSLLAMALDLKGKYAVSMTGSQAGIITTNTMRKQKLSMSGLIGLSNI